MFLSWSEDDQDLALAYMRAKSEVCPSCGTRPAEWREDRDAYIVDVDRCLGCEALGQQRDSASKDDSAGHGLRFFLRRPTEADYEDPNSDDVWARPDVPPDDSPTPTFRALN